ncbi:MAG: hypothetical protein JHC12_01815 [Thermogladius sp.]|nr:hypothetical protein [Thermogladius sp.]
MTRPEACEAVAEAGFTYFDSLTRFMRFLWSSRPLANPIIIVEAGFRAVLALIAALILRASSIHVILAPGERGLADLNPLTRGLLIGVLKVATSKGNLKITLLSARDYALLSTVLGRRADLSWRSVVLEASGKYLLYPSTPVFALQADSFRRVGEFLKLVSSNSVGLTILVSTRPLSLDQLNSMAINIVTTSYSDVTWSVSLCVAPSPCAQSILMAAECLRNRRAVVAPSEIGVLVGRPYREAVLRFELNNLENLFSALIAAVNRISTVKKIFIRGLEETR